VDDYVAQIEAGADWLGEWLRLHVRQAWPRAELAYEGAASAGSRYWTVRLPDGDVMTIGATEPALLEPGVREIPMRLDAVDWQQALEEARPDGLLISTAAQLFVWDVDRDRGTRLIEGRDRV